MDFLQKNLENLKEDNVGKREIVAKEYILIEPNDYQYSFIKISNVFERNVLTHIVSLYLPDNHYFPSTNVLGYRGKSRRR